jgi:hypothetical protein
MTGDRRQHRRVPVQRIPATVALAQTVRLVNLSPAGAMLEHREPLAPGQPCVLDLRAPTGDVHLRGHVVWSHLYSMSTPAEGEDDRQYRSGVCFADPPAQVDPQIRSLLR